MRRSLACMAAFFLAMMAGAASAAQPIYRNNVLTAQHVLVPGTHVRMVPPSGAAAASSFRGFEIQSRRIQIRIEERMGVSYQQAAAGLTPAALEANGITVQDTGNVTLNGTPALMVYGTVKTGDETSVGMIIFAFGNNSVSSLIYASYPSEDKGAVSLLRNALLSVIFQEGGQTANAGGGYTLTADGTSLQFVGEASMVRYFTVGGKQISDELDDAMFMSSQRNQQVPAGERRDFADKAIDQFMSNYEYTVSGKRDISYAGLQGFETIVDFKGARRMKRTASGAARYRNLPGKGYQVVLFDAKGVIYTFSGIAVRDADSYLSQFRRITGTFQITK